MQPERAIPAITPESSTSLLAAHAHGIATKNLNTQELDGATLASRLGANLFSDPQAITDIVVVGTPLPNDEGITLGVRAGTDPAHMFNVSPFAIDADAKEQEAVDLTQAIWRGILPSEEDPTLPLTEVAAAIADQTREAHEHELEEYRHHAHTPESNPDFHGVYEEVHDNHRPIIDSMRIIATELRAHPDRFELSVDASTAELTLRRNDAVTDKAH